MKIINIDREQFANLLFNPNTSLHGNFGVISIINDKMYKVYYYNFYDAYKKKDVSEIDRKIDEYLYIESIMHMKAVDPDTRCQRYGRLEETLSNGLITGVLAYRDVIVGIEMNPFKGYISLLEASTIVSSQKLKEYLDKSKVLIDDLLIHDIVPFDIREKNILVNIDTGDVVLIDLDGYETDYLNPGDVNKFPRIRELIYSRFEIVSNSLYKENSLNKKLSRTRET